MFFFTKKGEKTQHFIYINLDVMWIVGSSSCGSCSSVKCMKSQVQKSTSQASSKQTHDGNTAFMVVSFHLEKSPDRVTVIWRFHLLQLCSLLQVTCIMYVMINSPFHHSFHLHSVTFVLYWYSTFTTWAKGKKHYLLRFLVSQWKMCKIRPYKTHTQKKEKK